MSFEIAVNNDLQYAADLPRLRLAAETVLQSHDIHPDSTMTIVLTTNEAVQALNLQHRQVDAPTDVLSFPADPLPPEWAGEEPPYLGDLVIAYPYAKAQAEREKQPLSDNLALLVVHGTLHLLGYDHDTPQNRAEMWDEQEVALVALGIDPGLVPALEEYDDAG